MKNYLYCDIKDVKIYWTKKIWKKTKREHAFKRYASTYNVEFLHAFNTELQLKNAESAIKSKLIELLNQLKGFKFVTTLVLDRKHIENKVW